MKMRRSIVFVSLLSVAAALLGLFATWSSQFGDGGASITNGSTRIPMPDEKTADKVAKEFNKIERKAQKKAAKGK